MFEVFLVGRGRFELNPGSDGVHAFGVLGEDFAIEAVYYVDVVVEDQVALVAVTLMGVQVDYHNFED